MAVLVAVLVAFWLGTRGEDAPGERPSRSPSQTPSQSPSDTPSDEPSETPSETPTEEPSETPTEEPEPEPATVEVDPAAFIGDQVGDVERELAGLGLVPELVEVDNPGDAEEGIVVDVAPGGTLAEGDTVTISYYGPVPDDGNSNSNNGNGEGNGG